MVFIVAMFLVNMVGVCLLMLCYAGIDRCIIGLLVYF